MMDWIEPESFDAGTTVIWQIGLTEGYPSTDGWTLTYALVKADKQILVTGVGQDDGSYLMTIPAADSAAYPPGAYNWRAYVSKTGPPVLRYPVRGNGGTIEVHPNIVTATEGYDLRSETKKNLDSIQSAIAAKLAGGDVSNYSLSSGGTSYSVAPYTYDELVQMRDRLQAEYNRERRQERRDRGIPTKRSTVVRFP